MNLKEIKKRIKEIENLIDDPEIAHGLEYKLFYDFVESIKDDKFDNLEDIISASKELIKVRKLDFPRWTA